jgi:Zn finger protein HypA/HybF involved in hydrogenase expression
MAFINYAKQNYCRGCQLRVEKNIHKVRCPKCGRRLHTRKKNKLRNITKDTRIRTN